MKTRISKKTVKKAKKEISKKVKIEKPVKLEDVLKMQEKMNKNNKFSLINRETGNLIHTLIKMKKPINVLEIGTSIGYSTLWIYSALDKNAKLTTIERWHERAVLAGKFFKKANAKINLIEGDAILVLPKLNVRFDAVFIDATKKDYLKYLNLIKLETKSLVIADNTISHAEKMQDFLDFANKTGAITLEVGKGLTIWNKN